jgi:Txe/YoeB family toxin of Txe-Axe toxin-antitoxin module
VVGIEAVHVPPDADAATMEKLRLQVEALLNEATRRAYKAVGRPEAAFG